MTIVERLRALDDRAFPPNRWWGKSLVEPANYVSTLRFVLAEIVVAAACIALGITFGFFAAILLGLTCAPMIVQHMIILRRVHRARQRDAS